LFDGLALLDVFGDLLRDFGESRVFSLLCQRNQHHLDRQSRCWRRGGHNFGRRTGVTVADSFGIHRSKVQQEQAICFQLPACRMLVERDKSIVNDVAVF
jgi:hypothetical protein